MNMKLAVSSLCAAAALCSAGLAHAQEPGEAQGETITAEEVAPAIRYAMPRLYRGVQERCADTLDPAGFMATNDERLFAKYSEGADAHWAAARDGLVALASEGEDDGSAEIFAQLPDEAIKPFVDAAIPALLASEIKLEDCAMIEELMEVVDPLPADNFAQLIGLIVELGARDDKPEVEAE